MYSEDGFTPLYVGASHHHAAIEAPGPQQSRIEHVGTVGCRHQDHTLVRFKTVHFNQQLIERLLALIMAAAETGTAMPAYCVDLIDENDAGSVLLPLLKQVANAAGP